jgi:GDP-L-fucose synthase
MRHPRYDRIYHLAAWTQAGDFCLHHPGEQWVINQQINTNALAWWQSSQPQAKMIAMASSCCYPEEGPLSEEHFFDGTPTPSLFTYAMTKRMLCAGLRALNTQFGLNYLCLVPSTLYGSDYHLEGRQLHFIFDLIRKIVQASRGGPPPVLWGNGSQVRELIHVRDFVAAMLQLSESVNNELVNIGSGQGRTIRWFAERICEVVGYDPANIRYDTGKYVGAKSKVLSVQKMHSLLPDFAPVSEEQGIKEVVSWYLTTPFASRI